MPELLLFILLLVGIYAFTAGARFGHLSVISLFVYAQATMAAGTIPALDPGIVADQTHASLIMFTLATLVVTSFVASFTRRGITRTNYAPEVDYEIPPRRVAFLIRRATRGSKSIWRCQARSWRRASASGWRA